MFRYFICSFWLLFSTSLLYAQSESEKVITSIQRYVYDLQDCKELEGANNHWRLFDLAGRLIWEGKHHSANFSLPNSLQQGLYILQLAQKGKAIYQQKVYVLE